MEKESFLLNVLDFLKNDVDMSEALISLTISENPASEIIISNSYIDYDMIFVYSNNTDCSKKLEFANSLLQSLCVNFSKKNQPCLFDIKYGLMHPLRLNANKSIVNGIPTLYFHVSVFTEDDYNGKNPSKTPSPLFAHEWQKVPPSYGVSLKSIKNIKELSIDDIISAEFGIDSCLEMLESGKKSYWCCEGKKPKLKIYNFIGFDEYEMTVYLLKWCIKNTMTYFSQVLPIKPKNYNENTFKTLFLNSALNNDYEKMMTFSAEIMENKKEYNLSPDDYRKKCNITEILKRVFNILTTMKNKLISIKNVNATELSLPGIDSNRCPIYISIDLKAMIEKVVKKIEPDKILIITDTTVRKYYDLGYFVKSFFNDSNCEIYEYIIENANKKTSSQMLDVLMFAEEKRLTKASLIILFGGGSVGSIGGMVAKLYFRGIKFIYVPTTLLAQIDCAIGCKHSVNGNLGKNKFGVYHFPKSVIINPLIIGTLCVEHKKSGLSEALKYGLCQSNVLVGKVINYNYTCFDVVSLIDIIIETIKCKLEYMKEDPYASSPELAMEFGHNIAHALEFISEDSIPHGICVAFGMVAEAKLFSLKFGESSNMISMVNHITETVKKVVPNIELSCEYTNKQIADTVLHDNKRRKDAIPFIRLVSEQNPRVAWFSEDDAFINQLEESIGFAREYFK